MKTLYIVRHAKSSWDDPRLDDFDRPLQKRGRKDAAVMGRRLKKARFSPERIITSPAKRAHKTVKLMASEMNYPRDKIVRKRAIYEANVWTLLKAVRSQPDRFGSLMLAGHNPGITAFTNYLAAAGIENIPTCGVAVIEFDCGSWKDVRRHGGKLMFFDFPKKK